MAFDQGLDKSKPTLVKSTRPTKVSLKIAKLLHERGLADVWRETNPSKKDYTHFSYPHNTYARIDHILVPPNVLPSVLQSQIKDTVLSDHSMVLAHVRSSHLQANRGHSC